MLTIKELKDMSVTNLALGNAIKEARMKQNLSQEILAEMIGISPTHLKHIESEHRKLSNDKFKTFTILNKPSIDVLFKIVKVLNLSLDNILFWQNDNSSTQKLINEINNKLYTCTENELKIILDVICSLKANL